MQSDIASLLAAYDASANRAPKPTLAAPKPIPSAPSVTSRAYCILLASDVHGRPIGYSEPIPPRYVSKRGNNGATFAPFTYTRASFLHYPPDDDGEPYRNRNTFAHPYDIHASEQRAMRRASDASFLALLA